jgi:hypothetical protein
VAVGVGSNDPESIALVRRTRVVGSQHTPSRIIPQRPKVTEDGGKASGNKKRRVLHEDETRSNLADDSRHVMPQPRTLAGNSGALAGRRDVLAGKAARYDVNTAAPRSAVKGSNVIPYRERREAPVVLACAQYPSGVGVDLDGADGSPSKQVSAKYSATSARE